MKISIKYRREGDDIDIADGTTVKHVLGAFAIRYQAPPSQFTIAMERDGHFTLPDQDVVLEEGDVLWVGDSSNEGFDPFVKRTVEMIAASCAHLVMAYLRGEEEETIAKVKEAPWPIRHNFCCFIDKDFTNGNDTVNISDFDLMRKHRSVAYLRSVVTSGKFLASLNACLKLSISQPSIHEEMVEALIQHGAVINEAIDLHHVPHKLLGKLIDSSPFQRERYVKILQDALSFGIHPAIEAIGPLVFSYLPIETKRNRMFVTVMARTSSWSKIFNFIEVPSVSDCVNTTDIETLEEIPDEEAVAVKRNLFSRSFLNQYVNQGKSEIVNPFTGIKFTRYELLQMLKQGVVIPMAHLSA